MAGETALYSALSGDTSITGIVGDRIYSDVRDQGDKIPAIYFVSDTEYTSTLDSYEPLYEKSIFTLTIFQTTRELADALSSMVITATASSSFLCNDKQNSYDEETETYYTTIQLSYFG